MDCTSKKCAAELPEGAAYCHACGRKQGAEPRKRRKRGNGTGTAYKLQGRRSRPWVAAKSGTVVGYYGTRGEAVAALDALAGKPVPERYNMTFADVYGAWKLEHFRDIGKKGIDGYETAYAHLAALHGMRFRDVRTEHYQREGDRLAGLGRSRSAVEKLKQLAGQMGKWAMREDLASRNYAQFIRLPEGRPAEKEIFSDAEIGKLEACPGDAARIVLMLIYTGMRIGELFSMQASDVRGEYCVGGEKTDAGRNRAIPIPTRVRGHFAHFAATAGDGPLLGGYAGNRGVANFRRRDYYPLLEGLGIPRKSPHSTRHTYASLAVGAGVKPEHLQKILGHADYGTTSNIYVHAGVDELVAAAEKVSAEKAEFRGC
jgi:integrase